MAQDPFDNGWPRFHYEASVRGEVSVLQTSPGMPAAIGWCTQWTPVGSGLDNPCEGLWFGPSTSKDRPIIGLRRYNPGNEHSQEVVLIDGLLVPSGAHLDASWALTTGRKALIANDSEAPRLARDPALRTASSRHIEKLLSAAKETVQNPLKTLVIHAHSESLIADALAAVCTQLPAESIAHFYFSTLQFKADPTLRAMGVVDGQWEGAFPLGTVHVDLDSSATPVSIGEPVKSVRDDTQDRPSPARKKGTDATEAKVCPRCGQRTGLQRVWRPANERLGFAGLFDKRFTRRGAEMRRLIALAPYDCAECFLEFGTPECTPVILMGARRSGVSTLARTLGAGVTGDRSSTLLGIRETSTPGRSAFELRDFEGSSWLILDEGSQKRSLATLDALASVGKQGVLLYLADPTQFVESAKGQKRPGFPREVVTGMDAASSLVPGWHRGLVVTKCDQFIPAQRLSGSRQEARAVLRSVEADQILTWIDKHPEVPVTSAGGLTEGTQSVPSEVLLATASMLQAR